VRGESSRQCFARAIDAFDAFRILCAHHRGPFGVAEINRVLSARLRPSGVGSGAYWIGRPILITENDYSTGRFNGDIGLVVALADQLSVAFRAPKHDAGIDCVPIGRLPAHTSCFALTIHRSQGSQWSEVMVVLPTETSPILTRELIYTGVTRARTKAMVIGSDAVLEHALSTPIRRASGLRERLWGAQASQCAW
jgi:exodeoxyribonuclease V alpha subunit